MHGTTGTEEAPRQSFGFLSYLNPFAYIPPPRTWVNWIKFSTVGIGTRQFLARFARQYVGFLIKHNGFEQGDILQTLAITARKSLKGEDLGELPQGMEVRDGVSKMTFRFTLFGIPLLPSWTLQTFSGPQNLKNFSDVKAGARGFYEPPRDWAGIDNFVCKPYDRSTAIGEAAVAEKKVVKTDLKGDSLRLWLIIKHICEPETLLREWRNDRSLAYNLDMMANRIVMAGKFARFGLPDETYDLIQVFETMWHHPEQYDDKSIWEFINLARQNRAQFQAISNELNKQSVEHETGNPYLPEIEAHRDELKLGHDIVGELFGFHQATHPYKDKSEINTVAFLALFGNLPKLLSGAGALIFSNPELVDRLKAHIASIDSSILERKKSEKSFAPHFPALNSILNDETVFRCYLEVIRYWFAPPIIPRLNASLFTAYEVEGGHSMPPLSMSFNADNILEREGFSEPNTFNPFRDEYQFKRGPGGHLTPANELTKDILRVFNHEASVRSCPGRDLSYRVFCQVLYQWLHHDYDLTFEVKREADKPLTYDETAKQHRGVLRFERSPALATSTEDLVKEQARPPATKKPHMN